MYDYQRLHLQWFVIAVHKNSNMVIRWKYAVKI